MSTHFILLTCAARFIAENQVMSLVKWVIRKEVNVFVFGFITKIHCVCKHKGSHGFLQVEDPMLQNFLY